MPKTSLGRWAGWLSVISLLLLALVIIGYNTELLEVFEQGSAGGLALGVAAGVIALATLTTGAVSWLRLKDRSVVVIAATIYGSLATLLFAMGSIPQN